MFKKLTDIIAPIRNGITLSPREAVLCLTTGGCIAVACTMTGMVIGMLISPRKNVSIGSNNGGNLVNPIPKAEEPEATEE